MATKQSIRVKARTPIPQNFTSGTVQTVIAEYLWTAGNNTAAADVIEMLALPAGCIPVAATLETSGIAATATINVGIMTGEYGDKVSARTVGSELFAAAAKSVTVDATLAKVRSVAKNGEDRSIGLQLSALEAVGSGRALLRVSFVNA